MKHKRRKKPKKKTFRLLVRATKKIPNNVEETTDVRLRLRAFSAIHASMIAHSKLAGKGYIKTVIHEIRRGKEIIK